jgi:hypothetical protein
MVFGDYGNWLGPIAPSSSHPFGWMGWREVESRGLPGIAGSIRPLLELQL